MNNRQKRMVDIQLTEDELIITPRGIWKLWSFCRNMHIPYEVIAAARSSSAPERELHPRWRNPGLGTLGTLAGYTNGPKGRAWWCYKYGSSAVILDLDLPRLRNTVFVIAGEPNLVAKIRQRSACSGDRIEVQEDGF